MKTNYLTFEEFANKYFDKTPLYYVRKRDGYRYNGEEVGLAKDYYNETGIEP